MISLRKIAPKDRSEGGLRRSDIATQPKASHLSQKLVWIMALACGCTAANLYYSQPLLVDIAHSLASSQQTVGLVAMLAQFGFAAGLLLIVPLGDVLNRRLLITVLMGAVSLALIAMAISPSISFLAIASFAVGVTSTVAQLIVPFAAHLASPEERGRIIGTVMSGMLIGVLLARTVSGFVGTYWGWRAIYWIAAIIMLILLPILYYSLPDTQSRQRISYPHLLGSLWNLLRTEPILLEASILGALIFGAFSVFWVDLPFLLASPIYHLGSNVAGLFGLVGVVGATTASVIGKLADRINPRFTVIVGLVSVLLAFLFFWFTGTWLWGLVVGVILLDLGTTSNQVSNQARIYRLRPEVRNRITTIYMVFYFVGGSLGSALGTTVWSKAQWNGVSILGVLLPTFALIVVAFSGWRMKQLNLNTQ